MSNTLLVHIVDSINKHFEVSSWDFRRESSTSGNIFKEFSTFDVLENDSQAWGLASIDCLIGSIFSNFMELNNIRMIQLSHDSKFML